MSSRPLFGSSGVRQQVAGDLQAHELIVRHVGIERLDDEIAIVIGVGPVPVERVAVALGETGQVEPVPRPAFAVMRAGQQAVDQPFVGRSGPLALGDESLDFLRRRRQADQVEVRPANQRPRVGGRVGNDAAGFLAARTKRSIGVRPHFMSFTRGIADRFSG